MSQIYTLTEAKLSELISRVHFGNEKFTITERARPLPSYVPLAKP